MLIVPRRAEDGLLPWMDIAELQAMETLLRNTDTVLEYGAGGSTLWLAERVREVYVIEHDAAWAARILDAARANVHLICVRPERPHAGGQPADDGQFRTYIEACEWPGKKVDVCLIDGRARVDVALRVAKRDVLKAQGYLFFHD